MNNALSTDPRLIVATCQSATFDTFDDERNVPHQPTSFMTDLLKNAASTLVHRFQKQAAETNVAAIERKRLAGELYGMSSRELNDIGLSWSDIPDVVNGTYVADRRVSLVPFPSRTPAPELALGQKLAA